MLWIISLGISDENDMSLKAVKAGKMCKKLYSETYTTHMRTGKKKLERVFGRTVSVIDRSGMEEGSWKILRDAKKMDVGILVGGDALAATTHLSLIMDCRKMGIPYRIIHGSSIFTVIGECGLSLYKFGEVVTVPRWVRNFQPAGFYETIKKNKEMGLHSLLLLDVGMDVKEAVNIVLGIEKDRKERLFQGEKIVSLSSAGSKEQEIQYRTVEKLNGRSPAVLILPGRLNTFEKEFLDGL